MKIYKGDTVKFAFGLRDVYGKVLSYDGHSDMVVMVTKSETFFVPMGQKFEVGSYNFSFNMIKLVKKGWQHKHCRPFFKRLAYLFTNKF